jgi:Family of unknown function (DUF6283)
MARKACKNCPWRASTPPGGFPGGCVDATSLRRMADGSSMKLMQCHCSPDGQDAKVCVGFALRVGHDSIGYRIAGVFGLIDKVEDDGDILDSIEDVIQKHNTGRGLSCG